MNYFILDSFLIILVNIISIRATYREFPEAAKQQLERGRAAYVEIIANATSLNKSSTEISNVFNNDVDLIAVKHISEEDCWRYVLEEVESLDLEKCEGEGDSSRSLIALARTRCFFLKSRRPFPTPSDGCILNPRNITQEMLEAKFPGFATNPCIKDYKSQGCEKLKFEIVKRCTSSAILSDSAFQIYHADVNHIDDICFYLQSTAWRKRTEQNINKLGESTGTIIESHNLIQSYLDNVKTNQEEQIVQAQWMNEWLSQVKEELSDMFNLLMVIKGYHSKILDAMATFRTTVMYSVILAVILFVTLNASTKSLRPLFVTYIVGAWIIEISLKKLFATQFSNFIETSYIGSYITTAALHSRLSQLVRLALGISCSRIWLKNLMTYKPPEEIIKCEMKDLKKLLSNSQKWVLRSVNQKDVYTLDDIVATYNSDASSEGTFSCCTSSTDTFESQSLGSDSIDLVNEYLSELRKNKRRSRRCSFNFN